jgi:uncharacterized protein (TIGR03437 family)
MRLMCLWACLLPAAAQISVTPQRIAGVSPSEWPIGDGGPAVNALLSPGALAWDRGGNLLVADCRNHRIRRLTADGTVATVIDLGAHPETSGCPVNMAADSQGNLYVALLASPGPSLVVRIAPAGDVTEVGHPGDPDTAPALLFDSSDNLYLTDQYGFVWKRSPAGTLQKIAGNGALAIAGTGGQALETPLSGPHALAFDPAGNLLIADWSGVFRLTGSMLVRLAGGLGVEPIRIAPSPDGSIYLIGNWNGIWRLDPAGVLAPFTDSTQSGFSDGCAASGGRRLAKYATMQFPADLTVDSSGHLFISDSGNGRVRRVDPDGNIRTVAGTGGFPRESASGVPAAGAVLRSPAAVAVDISGNVFFSDLSSNHVHEVTAGGQLLTVAGLDSPPAGEDPACYTASGKDVLSKPGGLAVDNAGNLYIADTGNHRILRRTPDGTITTIAERPAIVSPTSLAVDPAGDLYFIDQFTLRRLRSEGSIDSPDAPTGVSSVAIGPDRRLVLNSFSGLYTQTPDGAFQPIRGSVPGEDNGAVAVDSAGAIYVARSTGLRRVSAQCNLSEIGGLSVAGVAAGADGVIYYSADSSIWRVKPAAAAATPSPYLDAVGVFNAASNLAAVNTVNRFNLFPPPPTYVNDAVTGNEIVRIRGGCLGPVAAAPGSTALLFDGVPARLLRVQSAEIIAVTPPFVAARTSVTMSVVNQSAQASVILNAAPAVPGVFVSSGTQAMALNEDGTFNDTAHPAPSGSLVTLFFTGAGATDPDQAGGFPPLVLPVTVQLAGASAEVISSGATPFALGLAYARIRVPPISSSNAAPVKLTVGGISRAQQTVTLAVQ